MAPRRLGLAAAATTHPMGSAPVLDAHDYRIYLRCAARQRRAWAFCSGGVSHSRHGIDWPVRRRCSRLDWRLSPSTKRSIWARAATPLAPNHKFWPKKTSAEMDPCNERETFRRLPGTRSRSGNDLRHHTRRSSQRVRALAGSNAYDTHLATWRLHATAARVHRCWGLVVEAATPASSALAPRVRCCVA